MSNFKIIRALQNYKEDKRHEFYVDGHHYIISILLDSFNSKIHYALIEAFEDGRGFHRLNTIIYDSIECSIHSIGIGILYLNDTLENYDDTELLYHIRQLTDDKIIRNPSLLSKIKDTL